MEALHRNGSELPTVTIHFPKRVHFSLRTLMIVATVAAIAMYFFVARPSSIANHFVAAVSRGDVETAESLVKGMIPQVIRSKAESFAAADRVYAEVLPREWNDIWGCRRRLILRFSFHEDNDGRHVEWTTDCDLVAYPYGIQANGPGTFNMEIVLP